MNSLYIERVFNKLLKSFNYINLIMRCADLYNLFEKSVQNRMLKNLYNLFEKSVQKERGFKMKYFKAKKDIIKFTNNGCFSLVKNELLTEKETKKQFPCEQKEIEKYFDIVEISKRKTFWNFGCRFECKTV